eukprot:m.12326 g.12326  ORF g.12326 m.12326 type:complete len:58 (-) comp4635_c0_seq1:601-774(-)
MSTPSLGLRAQKIQKNQSQAYLQVDNKHQTWPQEIRACSAAGSVTTLQQRDVMIVEK